MAKERKKERKKVAYTYSYRHVVGAAVTFAKILHFPLIYLYLFFSTTHTLLGFQSNCVMESGNNVVTNRNVFTGLQRW